mgnify:FL=1
MLERRATSSMNSATISPGAQSATCQLSVLNEAMVVRRIQEQEAAA